METAKRQIRNEKKGLLRQYQRSYFGAILIAAGIIAAILIFILRNSIRDKEIGLREDAVLHYAQDIGNQLDIFGEIYDEILTSPYYQPTQIFMNKYNEIPAADDISRFIAFSPLLDYLFLYYDGEELCFTSKGTKVSFQVLFEKQLGIKNADTVRQLEAEVVSSIWSDKILKAAEYDGEDKLLFLYPIHFTRAAERKNGNVIGFIVSTDKMVDRLKELYGYEFGNTTVYIKGQKCAGSLDIPEEERRLLAAGTAGRRKTDRKETMLYATSSDGTVQVFASGNWDPFFGEVRQNLGIILLVTALIASAFLLVSDFLARRRYQPIQRLAEQYSLKKGSTGDELERIESTLQQYVISQSTTVKNAKEQLILLILQGRSDAYMLNRWQSYGISLPFENNIIYVISVGKMSTEEQDRLIGEIESFSSPDAHIYAVSIPDRNRITVIASFNYQSAQEEMYENLLALTAENAEENRVYMGISCDRPEKLSSSYQEALNVMHSDNEAYRNSAPLYTRFTDILVNIQRCAEEGSYESVHYYLRQISQIFAEDEVYVPIRRYVCNSLLSTLALISYENHQEPDRQKVSDLLVEQDFDTFSLEYLKMMHNLLRRQEAQPETAPDKILKYVSDHLSDCDLCLDSLSLAFRLNVDYISRLIKQKTGSSFKEYVTQLRISRAKQLLLGKKELSVAQVGEAVGYRTPSNFIKKFRDEMGMTPLQFRSSAEPSESENEA